MSYPRRDEQRGYYPTSGQYPSQPQIQLGQQQDISQNLLAMYHEQQQSNLHTNPAYVLQQMAYLNNQVNTPSMNHQQPPPPPPPQAYYYPTANDYPHPQNSAATYQNQYSYPPPSHYSYNTTSASGYGNYPPPPPPPVQPVAAPPAAKIPDQKISEKQEKNSVRDQEPPPTPTTTPVKREQKVEEEKEIKKPVPIMVGKRRGGRVLPTGVVKKQRTENEGQGRSDAWSQYMAEVRRYKEQSCEEERKNRPLVK